MKPDESGPDLADEPAPAGVLRRRRLSDGFPPWGVRDCILALLAAALVYFVLLLALAVAVGRLASGSHGNQAALGGLLATFALELLLIGIALYLASTKSRHVLVDIGWRWRPLPGWVGWSVLAVLLAWFTLALYAGVTHALGLKQFQPQGNVPNDLFNHRTTLPLAVVLTVLTAPLAEETFFRGFIFNGLRRRLGFAGAAVASGAVFAVVHAAPTLIIPFAVIGVIFAYTYHRTGTLWSNVLAHCLFNSVSVAFLLAGKG